jgi:hypothetical protein
VLPEIQKILGQMIQWLPDFRLSLVLKFRLNLGQMYQQTLGLKSQRIPAQNSQ